ncbi:MAG TPA: hypothetical protein VNG13_02825 [Mycobacteriales bacterium]|nr:hypothetical protein [Mycobacteriales bacterium]
MSVERRERKTFKEIRAEQAAARATRAEHKAANAAAQASEKAAQVDAANAALIAARVDGQWWAGVPTGTIGVNVRYLNVRTPTKSMGMGTLKITDEGLQWRANLGPKVVMPWAKIEAVDVEGETTRRVTAARAMTLGVFALAARKSGRDTHLTVATADAEYGFLFEKTAPEVVRTKLRPLPSALAQGQATPVDGAADVPEQIVVERV